MSANGTLVAAVVGVDGCGKSSAFRGALDILAQHVEVVGIGDEILAGSPGHPLRQRTDVPFSTLSGLVRRAAKRTRRPCLYRQLKSVDLMDRSRTRDYVFGHEAPAAILTDGDPLVNTIAWSISRLYRDELASDDERILDAMHYLAGARPIPLREMPYYLRHAWQLAAVNRLHLARFRFPDLVVLLLIDGSAAMERIRRRGAPLQLHESVSALAGLGAGYERVCRLLEARCDVSVIRVPVERTSKDEVARIVADSILSRVPVPTEAILGDPTSEAIEVVATTMSGSLRDQRKIGRIGPEFRAVTRRPVRVHEAGSHLVARTLAEDIVARGGRIIVSAGGAGTFNAVLEGCHLDGTVPADLRLAFLRKGSADLIGKVLQVPDDLPSAVAAIADGIEHDRCVRADVLVVEALDADGSLQRRHLVGFGGLGIFGDVPRFTESRWIKLYKGVLSTLLGDYGPFFVGLALATVWWYGRRLRGRVPAMILEFDGEAMAPTVWSTIIVVSGDLGKPFPPGRGMSFSSGTFRVVAMRDVGLRRGLGQLMAARSGRILDESERYACLVKEAEIFVAQPLGAPTRQPSDLPVMVNIDGLQMAARGEVRFSLAGRVDLIAGPGVDSATRNG